VKDTRLYVFVVLVLIASILSLYSYFAKTSGVIVNSIDANSACKDIITTDSIITEVIGMPIKDSNDFSRVVKNLKGPITMIINGNPRSCNIQENSSLVVAVSNAKSGGLRLSVEINGGTYFLFKPENDASQDVLQNTFKVIKSRLKTYNLINTVVNEENDSIKLISGPDEEEYIRFLTERGVLEGGIIHKLDFTNKRSEFTLNESTYEILLKKDNLISINGSEYKKNQILNLNGLDIRIENISSNTTILFVKIFSNEDLVIPKGGVTQTSSSRIIKQNVGYVFVLPVAIFNEASKNFAKATVGQEIIINSATGEGFLKSPLTVIIDGKPFIELPVRSVEAGKAIEELILWGYKPTAEAAGIDMLKLKSLVEFKELPVTLILKETGDFRPTEENFYLKISLFGGAIPILITSVLFFARYKKNGVMVLPLILLCLGEIILILGALTATWFILLVFFSGMFYAIFWGEIKSLIGWVGLVLMFVMTIGIVMTNWVLDSFSVIGIIMVTPLSLILETIAVDKVLNKRDVHVTGELKHSLGKIWLFSSIATIVLLVLFFSVDVLRGLSATLLIAVLTIPTLITPIYFKMIESVGKGLKSSAAL
jgi:hypothetical protein